MAESESVEDWRGQYLGETAFPPGLTRTQLDELFTLEDGVAQIVGARRSPLTRLGLVLQIGFLRLTGRSLNSVKLIPPAVLEGAGRVAGVATLLRDEHGAGPPAACGEQAARIR